MGAEPSSLLSRLTQAVVAAKASDAHVRTGQPLFVRKDGRLTKGSGPALTAQQIEEILSEASSRDLARLDNQSWEFSFDAAAARFRGHAFKDHAGWAFTLRIVPHEIPTFQELRLPPAIKVLSEPTSGLVLVAGPMGSGKSTTSAAILKQVLAGDAVSLLTLEDPIEFTIPAGNGCVSQREVGRDVASYYDGLRAALREDPDYIFLGEIRGVDELEVALQAAETGRCVLSTFHTASAAKTIARLISMYPIEEQGIARVRIADVLRGVLCQRLLPRKGARTRILATEVMLNNYAVKECIRETNRLSGVSSIIERSADQNMHTMDQSLISLVRAGVLDMEVACMQATSQGDVRRALSIQGLG